MARFTTQPGPLDLTSCEREPIHLPSSIQPHGVLLVLDPTTLRVARCSANAGEAFARPIDAVLGATPASLFGDDAPAVMAKLADASLERNPTGLSGVRLAGVGDGERLPAIGHRIAGVPVIEVEFAGGDAAVRFDDLYARVQTFMAQLPGLPAEELLQLASAEVRRITGFDRVLVYRFDAGWNGTVVAESRNDRLPAYLDLRFPASDIPRQARELYRLNRLRLIADAEYTPVPLVAGGAADAAHEPLDMSFCALRSVSPIHVQYMKNMGTRSSMSISILRGGELWGLISCHSAEPRQPPFQVRAACDFLAQVLSLEVTARERGAAAEQRIHLKGIEGRLLASMAGAESFDEGLGDSEHDLLRFMSASGAAIVTPERVRLVGETPPADAVRDLARWLESTGVEDVWATHELPAVYPPAAAYRERASGLLSVAVSELHANYVLWFRPEVIQTVRWAGDPSKRTSGNADDDRLHPRKSFELWKQELREQAQPWTRAQLDAAGDLRQAIVGIVLRRAEELAAMAQALELSNKDLEAFSYSVSHDLRAPFRHIVGYSELLQEHERERLSERGRRYVDTIIDSAQYAGLLVDHLLQFSRMNRAALDIVPVDLNKLVHEAKHRLVHDRQNEGRKVEWTIANLPTVQADRFMLRLVIDNLLENALKYTRGREVATIEFGCADERDHWRFWVRDNGVGFDMAYVGKLFGVFQRLHKMEDYEGTGIGLANVRRIISRHGGETRADGVVDRGATFTFTLPKSAGEMAGG